ncbi:hypothetical protein NKH18_01530 [Streptomyces sp. M10(2022)]
MGNGIGLGEERSSRGRNGSCWSYSWTPLTARPGGQRSAPNHVHNIAAHSTGLPISASTVYTLWQVTGLFSLIAGSSPAAMASG